MDALDLLKQDHETMKKLLSELEKTEQPKKKRELYLQIHQELKLHEKLEETLLYPELQEHRETSDVAEEGYQEHHIADVMAEEMKSIDADDEVFDAKAKVLKELIEHHIEEEEGEMFPKARKVLGKERLMELGDEMEDMKEENEAA